MPGPHSAFAQRADISARSVLVTIFGDSVAPAGGEVWLSDLIGLCHQFGFNERLIRTSMFRLGAEGWFAVERVGRRSRYRLTPWAMREFALAEARIYGSLDEPWDGRWTLVFVESAPLDRGELEAVRAALVGVGFAPLPGGVLALPRVADDLVTELVRRAGIEAPLVTARAELDDVAALVRTGWLNDAYGLVDVADRYTTFATGYGSWTGSSRRQLDGEQAFGLRTMVVHEWRRARLLDPSLPASLLPEGWPAAVAREVAASIYHQVSPRAEAWLASTTGLRTDPARTAGRLA